jgi:hypothetical protein
MADENEVNFKVSDRRKFNADGTPRETVVEDSLSAPSPASQEAANVVSFPAASERKTEPAAASAGQAPRTETGPRSRQSEMAFLNLVNMIAVEAAVSLGLVEHPVKGGVSIDLETARHMIDMIGALEERTRGNLSQREAKMLEDLLSDLRMQYVNVSRRR